jgi:hypothetical protein
VGREHQEPGIKQTKKKEKRNSFSPGVQTLCPSREPGQGRCGEHLRGLSEPVSQQQEGRNIRVNITCEYTDFNSQVVRKYKSHSDHLTSHFIAAKTEAQRKGTSVTI